jgi:dihydrodipicolinate synthase/N-acetylneuraminate lyase
MSTPDPSLPDVFGRLASGRRPDGVSAALLPYTLEHEIDWRGLEGHVARTRKAGLGVAVNMDTGFGDLLTEPEREAVLDAARAALGEGVPFYAGAFAGDGADPVADYRRSIDAIEGRGAIPVVVQCHSMQGLDASGKAALYARILEGVERALAFELSPVFAPHGEIWDDETFSRLLELPALVGAKHSSLDRTTEFRRLAARDRLRPDFRIYTGNDLAIDLVAYGSDYLLGLSTFAPEAFASRDRALAEGNPDFLARNDALQHLGNVAFRAPVPAYKHSAAIYLHMTGGLDAPEIHPRAPRRPASERDRLVECAARLGMQPIPHV